MGTIAIHLSEAWAARQLGVSARFRHLLGLLRAPTSPFKRRVVELMHDVMRRPSSAD
jgi:hypothetical protein